MKRILFSHSYFLRLDPKQWATGQPYAPLGTLYAASLLRENDYTVSLHDTMFAHGPEELKPALEQFSPDCLVLYDDGFNYLTKMCLTNMREAAFRMCRMAKEQGCTVIVCSSDSTDHFDLYLREGADFVILGEGEITLLELTNALRQHRDNRIALQAALIQMPGLAYLQDGHPHRTAKRAVLKELDMLPLPAWDLVDLQPYRTMWMKSSGYFSMNVGTTRGCPFKCNWCAKPIYGNRYHARSPQQVVTELKLLKARYAFDHIWFCDDIFGLKPGWVQAFAECVQREGLKLRFKIQSRADLLVQENYVSALEMAGCENVWMGAESGSQQILDAMDKGTTIDQIYRATHLLKQYNIKASFFIQFGYPGETKKDIDQTIHMIRQLMPAELGISVSYPLPGTVFHERVQHELQQKTNWTDSDEMQLMFRNTYVPAFYKQLHRHVHRQYQVYKGWEQLKQLCKRPKAISLVRFKKAASLLWYVPASMISARRLSLLEKTPHHKSFA